MIFRDLFFYLSFAKCPDFLDCTGNQQYVWSVRSKTHEREVNDTLQLDSLLTELMIILETEIFINEGLTISACKINICWQSP